MNTVWPHRGEISYPGEMLGGKELCVYACTSELSGSPDFDSRWPASEPSATSSVMCSAGPFLRYER